MDGLQRGGVVKWKALRDSLKGSRGFPYAGGGPHCRGFPYGALGVFLVDLRLRNLCYTIR